jgi:hypothetical protein
MGLPAFHAPRYGNPHTRPGVVRCTVAADGIIVSLRRRICFLVGHSPGPRTIVLGIELRSCSRCGESI